MPTGKLGHNFDPAANTISHNLSVIDEREAKRISNAIDRRLAAEKAALSKDRTAKLLILGMCSAHIKVYVYICTCAVLNSQLFFTGAGESGKTTVSILDKTSYGSAQTLTQL